MDQIGDTAMADPTGTVPGFGITSPNLHLLVNVPVVHVTGIHNSFSNTGDLTSVISTNSRPVVVLNMNMMVAKTYAKLLADLVHQYELMTEANLDTMEELQAKFDKFNEPLK